MLLTARLRIAATRLGHYLQLKTQLPRTARYSLLKMARPSRVRLSQRIWLLNLQKTGKMILQRFERKILLTGRQRTVAMRVRHHFLQKTGRQMMVQH